MGLPLANQTTVVCPDFGQSNHSLMASPLTNQSTALVILPPAHQPTATLSGPHSLLGAGSRRESALDVGCHQGGAGGGQEKKVYEQRQTPHLRLQKQESCAKT